MRFICNSITQRYQGVAVIPYVYTNMAGATPKVSYPRKCAEINGCGENLSKSAYYRHINKNCCKPDQENIENDAIR